MPLRSNKLNRYHSRHQHHVQDEDWRARESAILALGAISEGCAQGLLPFLADMINMLLPKLDDPRPLVRSITCWALSRYSHWIVQASRQGIQLAQLQCDAILEVSLLLFPGLTCCRKNAAYSVYQRILCLNLPQRWRVVHSWSLFVFAKATAILKLLCCCYV